MKENQLFNSIVLIFLDVKQHFGLIFERFKHIK